MSIPDTLLLRLLDVAIVRFVKMALARLERITAAWPLVPARAGRDLGQYIRTKYFAHMKDLVVTATPTEQAAVSKELLALDQLHSNHFKRLYLRSPSTFTGKAGPQWGFDRLSSDSQAKIAQGSFTERLRNKFSES